MQKIIEIKNLDYTYLPGSPYQHQALKNISLSIRAGQFVGIFGANGSGKTTLAQQLNGLLSPDAGTVSVCNIDTADKKNRQQLWEKVGLVFQYPEHQIFQVSVYDEVAYGPRNQGLSEAEVRSRVYAALHEVGLDPHQWEKLTPFRLSGGMRRRVAIAGMLALNPEILILDEPMAGLDPNGQKLILDIIKSRLTNQETTLMISHNLKDVLPLADKIAILEQGALLFFGNTQELLEQTELLSRLHFELPDYLQVVQTLTARGIDVKKDIHSLEEAYLELENLIP